MKCTWDSFLSLSRLETQSTEKNTMQFFDAITAYIKVIMKAEAVLK